MANLEIAGALKRTGKGNADWYYGGGNEAWPDLASAKAGVPSAIRPGKTIGAYVSGSIVEYWWPDDTNITDADLIVKETPLPQSIGPTDSPAFEAVELDSAAGGKVVGKQSGLVRWLIGSYNALFGSGSTTSVEIYNSNNSPVGIWSNANKIAEFNDGNVDLYNNSLKRIADPVDPTDAVNLRTLSAYEVKSAKNSANGYAGLDSSGKIASAQLPSYVDDVIEYPTVASLPIPGESSKIYVITSGVDIDKEYRWSGSAYRQIVSSPGSSDAVTEGTTNLYFTAARVLGVLLSGVTFGTVSAVTATDSILVGIGKLQAQISDLYTNKVDKVAGKGLSTNDYTTAEQTKLSGIAFGATADSAATLTDAQTGTDSSKYIVSSVLAGWRLIGFNDQSGTAYTLALADQFKKVRMSNAAANTVTIPANSAVAFAVGTIIRVGMDGIGQTTIAPGAGVTLHGVTTTIDVQYNEALLFKEATDTWRIIGIAPDVSAIDGPNASIKNVPGSNTILFKDNVLQQGGAGNSVVWNGTNQYFTGSDTGMPSGTTPNYTISVYTKNTSGDFGVFGWGNISFHANATGGILYVYNTSTNAQIGQVTGMPNYGTGLWVNLIISVTGTAITVYLNGNSYTGTLSSYSITLGNGVFNNLAGTRVNYPKGSTHQILFYNVALNSTQCGNIYASGAGAFTPATTTGLIRLWQFNDGAPATTVADTNPTGTYYPLNLINTPSWGAAGSGKVSLSSTTTQSTYFKVVDGVNSNERGQTYTGDPQGGNYFQGYTLKHLVNGIIALIHDNLGNMYISNRNTSESVRAKSTVDIDGNLTIGQSNAGVNAAPANGLLVQGRTLLGTIVDDLSSILQLAGNLYLSLGSKIKIATGTNASMGSATLAAGTVTVSTTAVTSSSEIFLTYKSAAGTIGRVCVGTKTAGTSFVINSLNTDTTVNTADTSTISWWIIN